MTSWRRQLAACVLGSALFASSVLAAPALITTRPTPDGDTGKISFLVGGVDDSGRALKTSSVELLIDGKPASSLPVQSFADWATASAETSQRWRPPLCVGLVYQWIDGVPSGMLNGIHSFFGRLPDRTVVYPTIYGRLRQGRAKLTAGEISRLDDVPYLDDGLRPNLIEAIRFNLADLAADPAPLKILLLITDGRDFADPKGEGPGDFAQIGAELRRAAVTVLVTGFRPEADAEQSAANLRDLRDAAGGFLSGHDQAEDLENTLESLGQAIADLQRVEMVVPWSWSAFGGTHKLSARLTSPEGNVLTAQAGTVAASGSWAARWSAFFLLVTAGAFGVAVALRARSRTPSPGTPGVEAVLAAAHDLIRRGAPPSRAVDEIARRFPNGGVLLIDLDEGLLSDPRFPYLRTRPGRKRLAEIQEILKKRSGDKPALAGTIVNVLAEAVAGRLSVEEAAKKLSAHATTDERAAFVALDLPKLAEALSTVAKSDPALRTPRGRGIAVAIQDALRTGDDQKYRVSVGWLVRAGGPGQRGETLKLGGTRIVLGHAAACGVRITGDPALAPEHAEISLEDGEFSIVPLGGSIKVEGQDVQARQTLVDGETIELGKGIYVFKSASVRNLTGAYRTGRQRQTN